VAVGLHGHPGLEALLAALESQELRVHCAVETEELPKLLDTIDKATVVVYCQQDCDRAAYVLQYLSSRRRMTPVIVVVDQAEFSQYYDLMCAGAYDYYELPEGVDVIASAVRWAARTRAA
jgi:DNA-binding NtrC family response regulator